MSAKNDVLKRVENDTFQTNIYYNLDDEIIGDIKDIINTKKEPIVNIDIKDIETLKNICLEIEELKAVETSNVRNHIKGLVYEVYLIVSIYKAIIDTDHTKLYDYLKPYENKFKEVSKNKFEAINAITDVVKGKATSLTLLRELKVSMFELNNILESLETDVHLFGIENIEDQESQLLQLKINDIISWRGPRYRAHLYTKNEALPNRKTTPGSYLNFVHDYDIVKYENEKTLIKSK